MQPACSGCGKQSPRYGPQRSPRSVRRGRRAATPPDREAYRCSQALRQTAAGPRVIPQSAGAPPATSTTLPADYGALMIAARRCNRTGCNPEAPSHSRPIPLTPQLRTTPLATARLVIGVRGSTCASVFIVGAGGPGGVSGPGANDAGAKLPNAIYAANLPVPCQSFMFLLHAPRRARSITERPDLSAADPDQQLARLPFAAGDQALLERHEANAHGRIRWSDCHCNGETPYSRRNSRLKCSTAPKPTASATALSRMFSVSNRRALVSRAWLTNWWTGAPVYLRNKRLNGTACSPPSGRGCGPSTAPQDDPECNARPARSTRRPGRGRRASRSVRCSHRPRLSGWNGEYHRSCASWWSNRITVPGLTR